MAATKPLDNLQKEATCSICLEYYNDPVSTDCGHNFCRSCITEFWKDLKESFSCPQCRLTSQNINLRPNRQLQSIVVIAKELSQQAKRLQEEKVCEKHEEKLKLFCEDDQKAICMVCRESREHRYHTVLPMEEAAQEYKVTLQNFLDPLDMEISNTLLHKSQAEKMAKELMKLLETERRNTMTKFQELHQMLNEQEQVLLKRLEDMNKKIIMIGIANLTNLTNQLSILNKLRSEMEEKFNQSAGELLTDVKSTLKRCEKASFQGPDGNIKKLKVAPVYLTLDPKTANKELILSADRRSVKRGDPDHHLPDNDERFDASSCVLSCEGFTSGTHYWEVEVGDGKYWALGVVKESVKRKGKIKELPEEGVWAIDWCDGYHWALSCPQERLTLSEIPNKIAIYLDYEGGQMSFYNSDTMEHIYTFCDTFVHKLIPYFWVGYKTELKLL